QGTNERVPNIITTDQPGSEWTVETKLHAPLTTSAQQGGLIVYGGPADYVKFDVIAENSGDVRFELRSEVDDALVGAGADAAEAKPESGDYLLRLSRSGDTYSGAYSTDNGETWKQMPGTVENTVVADAGVGPFALGKNAGDDQIDVAFDYVHQVDGPEPCTPTKPEDGYKMLFDGTAESLAEWNMAGPGGFQLQPDCTILSKGGMGLLWHPEELGSYSFKADWKMAGDDNSGIFVGFPDPGDDPWVAVNKGYEIQIDATDDPENTTGAVYDFQAADPAARDEALNPPGEWNSYEIVVEGQTIKIYLNEVLINEFENPADSGRDLTQGFVGLQNHGAGDDVWFRNIQIKDLDEELAKASVSATVRPKKIGYGKTVRIRASVTSDADSVPSGEVVVREGKRVLGTDELGRKGRAQIRVADLDAGRHDLRVVYSGDESHASARTAVRLRVTKAASRTSVKVRPNPVRATKRATVRTRVRSAVGQPKGKVRVVVKRGKQTVFKRTTRLGPTGVATTKVRKLQRPGKYRVVTTYKGSANFAKSKARKQIRVRR
ncbi:MAG: DUF1080 domain-containing protein, partial [Actinomycetia bacterium]|nr:DUF1080 domain-containing protein [Actinomycetes bacterium]